MTWKMGRWVWTLLILKGADVFALQCGTPHRPRRRAPCSMVLESSVLSTIGAEACGPAVLEAMGHACLKDHVEDSPSLTGALHPSNEVDVYRDTLLRYAGSVSYTHLTLPTILLV